MKAVPGREFEDRDGRREVEQAREDGEQILSDTLGEACDDGSVSASVLEQRVVRRVKWGRGLTDLGSKLSEPASTGTGALLSRPSQTFREVLHERDRRKHGRRSSQDARSPGETAEKACRHGETREGVSGIELGLFAKCSAWRGSDGGGGENGRPSSARMGSPAAFLMKNFEFPTRSSITFLSLSPPHPRPPALSRELYPPALWP